MVEGGLYRQLYTEFYPQGAAGGWGDADVDGLGDGGLLTGMVAAVDVDGLGDGGDWDAGHL